MKKIYFLVLSVLIYTAGANAQVKKFQDLVGRWDIVGEEMPGACLEVQDSSNIYLTYGGVKKKVSDFTIDYSKTPCWFDFTVASATDPNVQLHVKSIVQVFGESAMKWQIFLEEDRSPYFTASRGELMYLKRASYASSAVVTANK